MKRFVSSLLSVVIVGFATAASGQDGGKGTVQNLLKDLTSSDYEKAWAAARELPQFPAVKAQTVPALIKALNSEWNQCSGDIREAIADSLAQLKAKEAVIPMLQLLRSGKNVAHECAECGCCFLAQTPTDALSERGFDPFCENSLLGAIYQLADFSHSKAMSDLVSEGKWKPQLLITIGKVGLPRYAHFIARHKDDPEAEVRIAVARALGLIENDQVTVPVLIQLLSKSNEEFSVKWQACESLTAIGKRGKHPTIKGRLGDLLKARDKTTVILAARALAHLSDNTGLQRLRQLAADKDVKIRSESVLYLGEAADADAKPILLKSLDDENLAVRASAIYALGRIGDASMIATLNKAFEASNAYQDELAKRLKSGATENTLRDQFGYGLYDLRQTLQEALESIQRGRKPN